MSGRADVSVCIVNWNGKAVLGNCLESLRHGQDAVTIEIIVVDNASTDGSGEGMQGKGVRGQGSGQEDLGRDLIVIRNQTNRGFSAGNNQAAAVAAGRYLFFLNNDTVVPPGSVAALVAYLDQHPDVVAVGPKLIGGDGAAQKTGRNLPTLRAMLHRNVLPARWTHLFAGNYRAYRHTFDTDTTGPVPQLAAAALLVRPEAFAAIGGWDEVFQFGVEDVDFCKRLSERGAIHYLADVSITHLGRVSSHMNRPWVFRSYQFGYVKYFRKHHRNCWAPLIYKIGITIDTPLRWVGLALKSAFSRALGRRKSAARSGDRAAALASFLRHNLLEFWRA